MKRVRVLVLSLFWLATSSCAGASRRGQNDGNARAGAIESTSAPATAPAGNLFAADEQSSRFTHDALTTCLAALEQSRDEPAKNAARHVKGWYCVCMTDALSVFRAPRVDVKAAAPKCVDFALHTRPKTPPTKRTPYTGKSFLSAGQISGAWQGCVRATQQKPETSALAPAQQETFCSCLVDNMRARRTTSTALPADATRTCAEAAGWQW